MANVGLDSANISSAKTVSADSNWESLRFNHTIVNGYKNRLLVVAIGNGDGGLVTGNVTYGGVALTKLYADANVDAHVELWYLINPSEGTGLVTFTLSAQVYGIVGTAMCFYNVDQLAPIRTFTGQGNIAGGPNTTIASAVGDMVMDVVMTQSISSTLVADGAQTEITNLDVSTFTSGGYCGVSTKSGAASVQMLWTEGAYDSYWEQVVLSIAAETDYGYGASPIIIATAGTSVWTCPGGVRYALIKCWGAGGSSGGFTTNYVALGAGGGAGGQYIEKTVAVLPGNMYQCIVAAGYAGTTYYNGPAGSNTYFTTFTGTVLARAQGGAGGQSYENGGAGGHGAATGGIYDVVYKGGDGGNGGASRHGGGGGGGAGTTGDGASVTANYWTGGIGHANGGGDGGNGQYANGAGFSGNAAGGGGGAPSYTSTSQITDRPCRTGGIGRMEIEFASYYSPIPTFFNT